LGNRAKRNITETVRSFKNYLPEYFVLPIHLPGIIYGKKTCGLKKIIFQFSGIRSR
jgi:hypothetical protein